MIVMMHEGAFPPNSETNIIPHTRKYCGLVKYNCPFPRFFPANRDALFTGFKSGGIRHLHRMAIMTTYVSIIRSNCEPKPEDKICKNISVRGLIVFSR
jgi:hypothetical protein